MLLIAPVRHGLESTMTLQMLAQMPLLALAGWLVAQGTPAWLDEHLKAWNHHGISGLLLASLTGIVWMLPRAMDAALDVPWVTLAKFACLPLLLGAPVALSWPRAGFVVRGVVLLEVIATVFRMGWLYLISPVRLCSNYLVGDQQRLGKLLLVVGFVLVAVLVWKLMWGHIDTAHGDDAQ